MREAIPPSSAAEPTATIAAAPCAQLTSITTASRPRPMHQDDAGHLHDQSRRQKSHTRHALEERREETGAHKREQGDKHERHRRDDAR